MSQDVKDILVKALDLLLTSGWAQKTYQDASGHVCPVRALHMATKEYGNGCLWGLTYPSKGLTYDSEHQHPCKCKDRKVPFEKSAFGEALQRLAAQIQEGPFYPKVKSSAVYNAMSKVTKWNDLETTSLGDLKRAFELAIAGEEEAS